MTSTRQELNPSRPQLPPITVKIPGEELLQVLKRVFGHVGFKNSQIKPIENVCSGKDTVAFLATGEGKSLLYMMPALARPGTGIVISPLLSLMRAQVDRLRRQGVRAAELSGESSDTEQTLSALREGSIDILYLSPERAGHESVLRILERIPLSVVAVDEAHCVDSWGDTFRPAYLDLGRVLARLPHAPHMAVTGTADPRSRREVLLRLGLQDAAVFSGPVDRPNIRISVAGKTKARAQLLAFVRRHGGETGIVYALSRSAVESIASFLSKQGLPVVRYHAGLDAAERQAAERAFLGGGEVVMVATVAFGMGIDRPDCRYVAHYDLPASMASYWQEVGRAGRDGQSAEALLLWSEADLVSRRRMAAGAGAPTDATRAATRAIDEIVDFALASGCRRGVLLRHFGEAPHAGCGNCDRCLSPPTVVDGMQIAASAVIEALTSDAVGIRELAARMEERHGLPEGHAAAVVRTMVAKRWLEPAETLGKFVATEAGTAAARGRASALPVALDGPAPVWRRPGPDLSRLPAPSREFWRKLETGRAEAAKAEGVAPLEIMDDAVLARIVSRSPTSAAELASIDGIGDATAARIAGWALKRMRPEAEAPGRISLDF